jgi:hypothetical protein
VNSSGWTQGLTGRGSRRTCEHVARATDTRIAAFFSIREVDNRNSCFRFSQPDRIRDREGSHSTRIDAEATDTKPPETKRGQKFIKMQKVSKRSCFQRGYTHQDPADPRTGKAFRLKVDGIEPHRNSISQVGQIGPFGERAPESPFYGVSRRPSYNHIEL